MQFYKNLLIRGTQKTSFKAYRSLNNLCGLESPSIINYLHANGISAQSDSKQLAPQETMRQSTPQCSLEHPGQCLGLGGYPTTATLCRLHTPKVLFPWHISVSMAHNHPFPTLPLLYSDPCVNTRVPRFLEATKTVRNPHPRGRTQDLVLSCATITGRALK